VFVHPLTALQESVVQALESLQLSGVPAVQVPPWQLSAPLHRLPSRHAVPFVTAEFTQPVVVLQLSVVQTLLSLQLSAVPAVQVPFWQVSAPLQTLLSLHDVPFRTGLCVQPKTGSQASVVHGLLSLQLRVVPGLQVPLWQVSAPLHTVLSAHDVPLGRAELAQPVTGLHESVVQTLESLQLRAVPAVQVPP